MGDRSLDIRKLRACLVCGYVQSFDGFLSQGCPNCESFLHLRDDNERVLDCTSATFVGLVGVTGTGGSEGKGTSWVVRWKGLAGKAAGLYAGRVVGRLTEEIEEMCSSRGVYPVVNQADVRR